MGYRGIVLIVILVFGVLFSFFYASSFLNYRTKHSPDVAARNRTIASPSRIERSSFLDTWIEIKVNSSTDSTVLEVTVPRNFPYSNNPPETPSGIDDFIFVTKGSETIEDTRNTTECFFVFSVPVTNRTEMILTNSIILTKSPYHGDEIPDSCISQTLVENVPTRNDGTITPLKQFKAGVAAEDAVCPQRQQVDEQFMLLISPNQKPYCVNWSNEGFMKRHGWTEPFQ